LDINNIVSIYFGTYPHDITDTLFRTGGSHHGALFFVTD